MRRNGSERSSQIRRSPSSTQSDLLCAVYGWAVPNLAQRRGAGAASLSSSTRLILTMMGDVERKAGKQKADDDVAKSHRKLSFCNSYLDHLRNNFIRLDMRHAVPPRQAVVSVGRPSQARMQLHGMCQDLGKWQHGTSAMTIRPTWGCNLRHLLDGDRLHSGELCSQRLNDFERSALGVDHRQIAAFDTDTGDLPRGELFWVILEGLRVRASVVSQKSLYSVRGESFDQAHDERNM